jgi:hypothetical protein
MNKVRNQSICSPMQERSRKGQAGILLFELQCNATVTLIIEKQYHRKIAAHMVLCFFFRSVEQEMIRTCKIMLVSSNFVHRSAIIEVLDNHQEVVISTLFRL